MRHPKAKRSAAQTAAAAKFAAAGRASQARRRSAAAAKGQKPSRSKKQVQATLKFLAAGRAAAARKRAHLKPLPKKTPAWTLHGEPVCAPVAIAEHLYAHTGIVASDADIMRLGDSLVGGSLGDYIEAAARAGFCGARLAAWWPCDEELTVAGLIYGVRMRGGYHAVLAHPQGMVSWGLILPRLGIPDEAWHLEWELPGLTMSYCDRRD